MKRGTPDHPKMLALASALDIPIHQAVGLLEMLWHFTARYAPIGDIGKWSDSVIANRLDWREDQSRLIQAFVATGWLEKNDKSRLVIHGWSEHSDDAVDKYLNDKGLLYWNGDKPRRGTKSRLVATGKPKINSESRQPEPEPEPEPKPEGEGSLSTEEVDPGKWKEGWEAIQDSAPVRHMSFEAFIRAIRAFPKADANAEAKKFADKYGCNLNAEKEPGRTWYSWMSRAEVDALKSSSDEQEEYRPRRFAGLEND
jgi:hypothetical protein